MQIDFPTPATEQDNPGIEMPMIDGHVAPGFEPVTDEFRRNFQLRGDVGAAFSVVQDGVTVVDLWGGLADRAEQRPWREDTLQLIFSGTKGLVAVCLLILIDRGHLSLDEPVSSYWPEFSNHDKESILVRDVVTHHARLPAVQTPLAEQDLLDPEKVASLLAAQGLESDPRAKYVYHAFTYGWLAGELIKRVDGRSVGDFFAEEVARPLALETWIGLPAQEEPRVSRLEYAPDWGVGPSANRDRLANDLLLRQIWCNPPIFPPGRLPWNTPEFHRAEIPGAGAITTARSVARLYGCLARGGKIDGVVLLSPSAIQLGQQVLTYGMDPFDGGPIAHGVGFALQTATKPFGPPANAFGHRGAGGSLHGAWPEHSIGFSYCMNQMRDAEPIDGRHRALLECLWSVLQGSAKRPSAHPILPT